MVGHTPCQLLAFSTITALSQDLERRSIPIDDSGHNQCVSSSCIHAMQESVAMMMGWMKTLETVPTIVALKKRAEGIRQVEVAKVLARLPDLSDAEREIVDGLASSIVNKLLHRPLVTLKEEAANANSTMYVDATRRLFSLDEEHSPDK